jgi:tetratricopeptide (TPR) repeat protein
MNVTEPVNLLVNQARQAAQEKRYDVAADLLEKVLAQAPDHLMAVDLLGFVYFFQGKFSDAEQCCRRALEVKPNHPYALKGLGLCLARQGQVHEGIIFLERAITMSPTWLDPYWDLGVVLFDSGQFEKALEVLVRGQAALPDRKEELEAFAARIRSAIEKRGPQEPGG